MILAVDTDKIKVEKSKPQSLTRQNSRLRARLRGNFVTITNRPKMDSYIVTTVNFGQQKSNRSQQ